MTERPGFMLYFELADALYALGDAEAGALFKALMAYAQWGEVRELTGLAEFAFKVARPRIDKDGERYAERCRKNTYAVYVRDAQRRRELPLEYEDWCREASNDIKRYPTITQSNPATTAAAAAATTAAAVPDAAPAPTANSKTNKNTDFYSKTKRGDALSSGNDDTAWVLPYLDEIQRNRKEGAECRKRQTG